MISEGVSGEEKQTMECLSLPLETIMYIKEFCMIDSEMYSPTAKLIREGWWIKLCNLRRICLEEPTLEDNAISSGPFGATRDDVSGVWSLLRYDLDELGLWGCGENGFWGWTTSYFRNTHAFHMKVHSYLLRKYKQRQTWYANKQKYLSDIETLENCEIKVACMLRTTMTLIDGEIDMEKLEKLRNKEAKLRTVMEMQEMARERLEITRQNLNNRLLNLDIKGESYIGECPYADPIMMWWRGHPDGDVV